MNPDRKFVLAEPRAYFTAVKDSANPRMKWGIR